MKCKICKQKTDWDESYGLPDFIICPRCFKEMAEARPEKNFYEKRSAIMEIIFTIGRQIEKVNNKGAE